MLLEAKYKWPQAIDMALWPYALQYAYHMYNHMLRTKEGNDPCTPYKQFAQEDKRHDLRESHPFGCPAYILHDAPATGGKVPKWEPKARLGIYLGISDLHTSCVALVINPFTGLVSPQYHVWYDNTFETACQPPSNLEAVSTWKALAGLVTTCNLCSWGLDAPKAKHTVDPILRQQQVATPSRGLEGANGLHKQT